MYTANCIKNALRSLNGLIFHNSITQPVDAPELNSEMAKIWLIKANERNFL